MPTFNYADVSFRVTIDGDGRRDRFVLRPVNPATAAAWSPPIALGVTSPILRKTLMLSGSFSVTGAQIAAGAPYAASYIALVPPGNSVLAKTMQGTNTDTGIPLIPNGALILALPNPLPATWKLYLTLTGTVEPIDLYFW